jgi:hypothetical protein
LLNLTAIRNCNAALDHIYVLLHPRTNSTKMVQDVPLLCDCPSSVFIVIMRSAFSPHSFRMEPSAPTGLMRFSGTIVVEIPRTRVICTSGRAGCFALRAPVPQKREQADANSGNDEEDAVHSRVWHRIDNEEKGDRSIIMVAA